MPRLGILFFLGCTICLAAEDVKKQPVEIYQSSKKSKVSWNVLEAAARDVDVIIFGEDHDDKAGHAWKLEALKLLAIKLPVTLSLEMLERDQQVMVDEFLRGDITEKAYLGGSKFWPNYTEHYHPLVAFAKEKDLSVVASNIPKRYANLVAKGGLEALYKIRSPYLPPIYLIRQNRQKDYEDRVAAQLAAHAGSGFTPDRQKFIDAQYLWDTSMTDAVAAAFYAKGRRVVHVNGRFHSERNSGVAYRLRQLGLKVLVVNIFPGPETDWQLADFLVITPKPVP